MGHIATVIALNGTHKRLTWSGSRIMGFPPAACCLLRACPLLTFSSCILELKPSTSTPSPCWGQNGNQGFFISMFSIGCFSSMPVLLGAKKTNDLTYGESQNLFNLFQEISREFYPVMRHGSHHPIHRQYTGWYQSRVQSRYLLNHCTSGQVIATLPFLNSI